LSLEVALAEVISALAGISRARADQSRPVRRAMEYIRARLTESITLGELASHAGVDKFHLCRAFRAQIGMPPHTYMTHLRVARAKELLVSGERPPHVIHSGLQSTSGVHDVTRMVDARVETQGSARMSSMQLDKRVCRTLALQLTYASFACVVCTHASYDDHSLFAPTLRHERDVVDRGRRRFASFWFDPRRRHRNERRHFPIPRRRASER
jgi:AraC-like DNA-binding protein